MLDYWVPTSGKLWNSMVVFMFTALSSFKRGARFSKVLLNWGFYCTIFFSLSTLASPKGRTVWDWTSTESVWNGRDGKMKEGLGHWRNIAAICNVGLSFTLEFMYLLFIASHLLVLFPPPPCPLFPEYFAWLRQFLSLRPFPQMYVWFHASFLLYLLLKHVFM